VFIAVLPIIFGFISATPDFRLLACIIALLVDVILMLFCDIKFEDIILAKSFLVEYWILVL